MLDVEWSEKLVCFFEGMLEFYKKFLTLEQEKYSIVTSSKPVELKKLDGCMKREQAFTLKARGLECERQKLLAQAQAPQGSFRELVAQTEPSRRDSMEKLYRELSQTVAEVQSVNERCSRMTKIKIGSISHLLSDLENHPELRQIYGDKLKNTEQKESAFSEKI